LKTLQLKRIYTNVYEYLKFRKIHEFLRILNIEFTNSQFMIIAMFVAFYGLLIWLNEKKDWKRTNEWVLGKAGLERDPKPVKRQTLSCFGHIGWKRVPYLEKSLSMEQQQGGEE